MKKLFCSFLLFLFIFSTSFAWDYECTIKDTDGVTRTFYWNDGGKGQWGKTAEYEIHTGGKVTSGTGGDASALRNDCERPLGYQENFFFNLSNSNNCA